jgi:molecular chaperone DnaK
MSKAIGIDLGTTNSVVGIKTIDTQILTNTEGEQLTPSVVGVQKITNPLKKLLKKDSFLVGKHALDWMLQDPENTIVSIKRLMGRGFSDIEIKALLEEKHFAFTLKPLSNASEHSLAVVLNQQEYTPEQISAKILEKIKHDSEQQLNEPVEYAVVTVPAYFNDKQKDATRKAAALAGLKVQRLLPEPTAAAISFGVDNMQPGEARTVLVYDLGGGTFDISVLTISDGQFIEQGKGGDMWMGGDDIDNLIRQYVYSETEKENDVENLPLLIEKLTNADKNRFLGDLKRKVEEAKITLSTQEKAYIDILGLLRDEDGDILDVDVELSQIKFETLLTPFVERTISLTRKLLEDINFDIDLIEQVIMVGGSSNIPLVAEKIKQLFGADKVLVHPRPMLAIAEGASILAHRLADFYECPHCGHEVAQNDKICTSCQFDLEENLVEKGLVDIVHTSSHDYFLELEGGKTYLLAEKNTPLPFHVHSSFKLVHKEQKLAHLKFSNEVNDKKESIGELWLSFNLPIEYMDKNELPEIQLDFEIDINNLITASASLDGYPDTEISKTLSRGGADEQLFIELENSIEKINKEKTGYYSKYEFLIRALKLANQINQVIDPDTGEMNGQIRDDIIKRNNIALAIFEEDESFFSNIYYAQDFISNYSYLLEEKEQTDLKKALDDFKEKTEHGELKEIIQSKKKLFKHIDKHPILGVMMDIENAAELVTEDDPNHYIRFSKCLTDLANAFKTDDVNRIQQLIDDILPEVNSILDRQADKDLHIWKGVQV